MTYIRPVLAHESFPAILGVRKKYTLASLPLEGSEIVCRNGLVLRRGVDYTLAASTLTVLAQTTPADLIYVVYRPT